MTAVDRLPDLSLYTADLPYPEPLEVTVVDADGQPVTGARLQMESYGTVAMPGGTANISTIAQTDYDGAAVMTRLHRGDTPWQVWLDGGL